MNRIKEVLKEKGIKQTWLAEKIGKSFNMVNDYSNNRRQPTLEILFQISEILNVSPKDLLDTKVQDSLSIDNNKKQL
jgi:transcriptional regulator with XRE-family HTH domain